MDLPIVRFRFIRRCFNALTDRQFVMGSILVSNPGRTRIAIAEFRHSFVPASNRLPSGPAKNRTAVFQQSYFLAAFF